MHIHELKLERFRGADSLSLTLDSKLNVFVGMNGAGKSSILDAAAILLSWLMNRIKSLGISGRRITETDIIHGKSSASLGITLEYAGELVKWSTAKIRKGHNVGDIASGLSAVSALAKQVQTNITDNEGQIDLPLFVYYPVNRAVLDIPLRIRERHRFDLLSAYDEALTGGANFRTFFEWFREREDLENEARRDKETASNNTATQFPDPQLEAVRGTLSMFMPDFKNLTVRRNPLRMEIDKLGKRLTVNQLSDGEKCLLAMVGDLARRLAIANPLRDDPLHGEGIVLIDEIDLHLHPAWQRMVIPRLTETFPNCQFLVSTHSPHVVTHVRPENLFLLSMEPEGLQALSPKESYGKTAERVLEDLMGLETTRPAEVNQAFNGIYDRIGEGELEEARELIARLKERIGADPDLSKAEVLIRRKESIGK